jgi:hypothetical protein
MTALWRLFLTTLSAILLIVSLSGCATPPTRTEFITTDVPVSVRTCAYEPALLKGDFTQKDVAIYIEKLRAAWRECYNDLGAVNEILDNLEAELKAQAKKE